jgi:Golgin subfamily A member 7/ERF4 family
MFKFSLILECFCIINVSFCLQDAQFSLPIGKKSFFLKFKSYAATYFFYAFRFPQELEGRIDRATFERTIAKINEYFMEAEKGNCSTFCEGFCACFSAYLIYLFTETHYEKVIGHNIVVVVVL